MLGSAVPAAAGVCRDVLLVGVDGGGERPGQGSGLRAHRRPLPDGVRRAGGQGWSHRRRAPRPDPRGRAPSAAAQEGARGQRPQGPRQGAGQGLAQAGAARRRPHDEGADQGRGGLPRAAGGAGRLLARRGGHAPRAAAARGPTRRPRPRGRGHADRRPRPGGQDLRHGRRRPACPPRRLRRVRARADPAGRHPRSDRDLRRLAGLQPWRPGLRAQGQRREGRAERGPQLPRRSRRPRRTPRGAQRVVQHRPGAHPGAADAVGLDAPGPAVLRPARGPREGPSRSRRGPTPSGCRRGSP